MTKTDIQMLAKSIGESNLNPSDKIEVLKNMSKYIKKAYPKFNETKFTVYCQKFFRGE